MILKLNEEQNRLKLISVNDGYDIVYLGHEKYNEWCNNGNIVFSTKSFMGVPKIDVSDEWVDSWEKVCQEFIKGKIEPHAYRLGFLDGRKGVFTEEQVREAINLACNSIYDFRFSDDDIIKSLKQPRVEVTFENDKPVKARFV